MTDCTCHSHNGFSLGPGGPPPGAAQREAALDALDDVTKTFYLDKVGSVSGLELERDFHVFDDVILDEQYRRFHNGS